jgi:hypothetical protein
MPSRLSFEGTDSERALVVVSARFPFAKSARRDVPMDKADAASLTWEEIREALIRFPTEKLLREHLSQRHGASLVSMGVLVAPWPSPGEPLGVLSFAARR